MKDAKHDMLRGMHNRSDLHGPVRHQEGLGCATFNALNIAIPSNRRQMLNAPDARHWLETEKVEMDSMNLMKVYEPLQRSEVPRGTNV